jgi:hypothetical protein
MDFDWLGDAREILGECPKVLISCSCALESAAEYPMGTFVVGVAAMWSVVVTAAFWRNNCGCPLIDSTVSRFDWF